MDNMQPQPMQTQANPAIGTWQYNAIKDGLKQHTGRDAADDEIFSYLGGGHLTSSESVNYSLNNIRNSQEAKNYAASQAKAQAQPQGQPESQQQPPPAGGSPVTATGQIPLPSPTVMPTPSPKREVEKVAPPPTYQANGGLPPSYVADTLSQFKAPDQSGINGDQMSLMHAILANPQTMNPAVVAQLKEASKQEALSMMQQTQAGFDTSAGSRLGSGALNAAGRDNTMSTIGRILDSNRGIDINAAQTNRQDELNALTSSEALASGQLGRAVSGYNTTLGGQTAQAGLNVQANTSALQRAIEGEHEKQIAAEQAMNSAQFQWNQNLGVASNAQSNYNQDIAAGQIPFQQMMQLAGLRFNYDQLDVQDNGQLASLIQSILNGRGGN